MKKCEPLSTSSQWTFHLLEQYEKEIARLAQDFGLVTYPITLEIISSEQMMDAYATSGLPIAYPHWSYGKRFLSVQKHYMKGHMGLAYEIVINANPCIAYLMEENTMAMQALVIAHAAYGHNSFFKNNYLFKDGIQADSVIDYLVFAKNYIIECERQHGVETVERFIDSCHALQAYGVDRYPRAPSLNQQAEKLKQRNHDIFLQSQLNELWRTLPDAGSVPTPTHRCGFLEEPQENILYFIEKHAPMLAPWQREIIRIVRKMAQYFYPQQQTQVINEGWACFWHYTLMHALYDEGLVTDEFMLEIVDHHTSVVHQLAYNAPHYHGINPYALGYNMMQDIKRIASTPTEEDKRWFPELAGTDWQRTLTFAMENFKDESFVAQYLSPKLIRDLHLFTIQDDDNLPFLEVTAIHNEQGYQSIRETLSKQYDLSLTQPFVQVFDVDMMGDRRLTLRHQTMDRKVLAESTDQIMKHLHHLWGFPVTLECVDEQGNTTQVWQETGRPED